MYEVYIVGIIAQLPFRYIRRSDEPCKTEKCTQMKTIVLKFMYSSMIPNDNNTMS